MVSTAAVGQQSNLHYMNLKIFTAVTEILHTEICECPLLYTMIFDQRWKILLFTFFIMITIYVKSSVGLHDFRFFVSRCNSWHQIVVTGRLFRLSKVKICLKFKVIFLFWNIVMIEQVRTPIFYKSLPKSVHQQKSWE